MTAHHSTWKGVPARESGRDEAANVAAPHRTVSGVVSRANFAFHSEGQGWRVVGDADCAVEIDFRAMLAVACASGTGDVHLFADKLRFVDAAGARVIVEAAQRLGTSRRLVLHGLAVSPRKVFRLTGWDHEASLVFEEAR